MASYQNIYSTHKIFAIECFVDPHDRSSRDNATDLRVLRSYSYLCT